MRAVICVVVLTTIVDYHRAALGDGEFKLGKLTEKDLKMLFGGSGGRNDD